MSGTGEGMSSLSPGEMTSEPTETPRDLLSLGPGHWCIKGVTKTKKCDELDVM